MLPFDPGQIPQFIFSLPFIGQFWWLWTFVIFVIMAVQVWLSYAQEWYRRSIKWVLLEIKIPREHRKAPKAMEQVFTGIHALRNSQSNVKEHWWDGEVTLWFSAEIASFGGEVHFYMWVPQKHKNMVVATLYSQYSDLEITETEDYIRRFPPSFTQLAKNGFNIFGNELKLEKNDAYPIRTYIEFEAIEEEKQLDPISAILEVCAGIKPQETIWIQILFRPTDNKWQKEGKKVVEKLKEEAKSEYITDTGRFTFTERSPGDLELMKAVERNIAKPGFEALIRWIYISPKEMYDANFGQRGLFSAFNQYASASLNRFKHNTKAWTRASFWYFPHLFPKKRALARRQRIYRNYRERKMYEDEVEPVLSKLWEMRFFHWGFGAQAQGRMVLNTEELATLYHPPIAVVLTGPLIKRVEAKKGGPPAGLPIYGGDNEKLPGVE